MRSVDAYMKAEHSEEQFLDKMYDAAFMRKNTTQIDQVDILRLRLDIRDPFDVEMAHQIATADRIEANFRWEQEYFGEKK